MTDSKSVKLAFDCVGGDFERAGEASSKIKTRLQRLGIPADIVRRIAIGKLWVHCSAFAEATEWQGRRLCRQRVR